MAEQRAPGARVIVWRRMVHRGSWQTMMYGAVLALGVLLAGCQSPWIAVTVVNHQTTAVSLVEVSYPGGSFGIQTIAPGGSFHYRFHSLGTDTTSVDFTDAAHKKHTEKGPQLQLGQEGTLGIEIQPDNHVIWTPVLRKAP